MAYAILLLSQLAVGSAAILARWGLGAGLPALALTAWRLALASAALLPGLRMRRLSGISTRVPPRWILRLVAAGLALAGHFWTWFASLQHISVARSTLLVSTTPVWAALGMWVVRGRPPGARFWLGLVPALAGAWLVTGCPAVLPASARAPVISAGDLLATVGAILIAVYFLLTADLQRHLGTARVVAWTYSSAAVAMVLVTTLSLPLSSAWPARPAAWQSVVGMALLPQLAGHTMMNWSLRHFSAATVGTATLLEPVFAGALAWWILGERVSVLQMVGGLVLLGSIAFILTDRQAGRTSSVVSPVPPP